MNNLKFLRDVVVSSGNQSLKQDAAEDIMRLAQDPLLLHEHLQERGRDARDLKTAVPDGQFEDRLQDLAAGNCDHQSAGRITPATSRYPMRENLAEPSLYPRAFAASDEDRTVAIDQFAPSTMPSDDGSAMPRDLIGGILIIFGFLLFGAAIFDVLTAG